MPSEAKLLLIEDNSRIRETIETQLAPLVKTVISANDGISGLLAYNKHRPHILIVEQFLPLLSGEEIVRRIRTQTSPQQLPILMLSSSRFGHIDPSFKQLLNHTLAKPLHTQHLLKTVEWILKDTPAQAPPPPLSQYPNAESLYLQRGTLEQSSLPELIIQYSRIQKPTGLLSLSLPEGERRFAFSRGRLVHAESLIPQEQFSALMQSRFAQHAETFQQETAGSGGRASLQHEAITRANLIPHQEVDKVFLHYKREILTRTLFLDTGAYHFIEDQAYVQRCLHPTLELLPLLFEGVRRYYSSQELQQEFAPYPNFRCQTTTHYPSYEKQLQKLFPNLPNFSFQNIEHKTLNELQQHFSTQEELNNQILKTLLLARLITFQPPAPKSQPQHTRIPSLDALGVSFPSQPQPSRWQPAPQHAANLPHHLPAFTTSDKFSLEQVPRLRHPSGERPRIQRITQEQPRIPQQPPSGPRAPVGPPQQQRRTLNAVRRVKPKLPPEVLHQLQHSPDPIKRSQYSYYQGKQALLQQHEHDALIHFQKAFQLNPDEPRHSLYLGWLLFLTAQGNTGQILASLSHLQQTATKAPNLPKAHLYLGIIHKHLGNLDQAATHLQRLLQLEPGNPEAIRLLQTLKHARRR